jgi:lysophospholipase L1-like esterase
MLIQILGDSYARRFAQYLRQVSKSVDSLHCEWDHGISGARISDLKGYLKGNINIQASIPLLILIGTNDFLDSIDPRDFKNQFLSLLRLVRRKLPGIVIILATLPQYPRISQDLHAVQTLHLINRFLVTLRSDTTRVIQLAAHLSSPQFFHSYYGASRRVDKIHLNNLGHQTLLSLLKRELKSS